MLPCGCWINSKTQSQFLGPLCLWQCFCDMGRLERWSIFCGDGMVMVIFSQRWNGDGFWKFLTITINGFWWDQPSATMVFRWFCNFWEPMVNNGHWRKNAYFATNSNSQQIAGKLKNYKKSNTAWLQNTLLPIHTADIPICFQVCNPKTCYQHIFWNLVWFLL